MDSWDYLTSNELIIKCSEIYSRLLDICISNQSQGSECEEIHPSQ